MYFVAICRRNVAFFHIAGHFHVAQTLFLCKICENESASNLREKTSGSLAFFIITIIRFGMQKSTYRAAAHILSGFLAGIIFTVSLAFQNGGEKPAAALMLEKNNLIYTGVDNPATVVVRGFPPEQVTLQSDELTIKKTGDYTYSIRANKPGIAKIRISSNGYEQAYSYRVKSMPSPVALIGTKHASKYPGKGEFRAQTGVFAVLESFDFDAKCYITGYHVTYLHPREEPEFAQNSGGRFNEQTRKLIDKARPGDVYMFDEIRCKCPGDTVARGLESLVITIK
jgi:hypothetical protein